MKATELKVFFKTVYEDTLLKSTHELHYLYNFRQIMGLASFESSFHI